MQRAAKLGKATKWQQTQEVKAYEALLDAARDDDSVSGSIKAIIIPSLDSFIGLLDCVRAGNQRLLGNQ